jgi:hypothetical protein
MSRGLGITAAVAFLGIASASYGQSALTGSFSATTTTSSGTAPTVSVNQGTGFLTTPFSQSLTVGTTTATQDFIQINPPGSGSGTQSGQVDLTFTGLELAGSSVTGVTASGGAAATLSGGNVSVDANYELFWSNQTDCIVWSNTTCTATGNQSTIGDTLVVTFASNAVVDINLYNWSDWNMQPDISFEQVTAAHGTSVPEPASLVLLVSALAGLGLIRRHRQGGAASAA